MPAELLETIEIRPVRARVADTELEEPRLHVQCGCFSPKHEHQPHIRQRPPAKLLRPCHRLPGARGTFNVVRRRQDGAPHGRRYPRHPRLRTSSYRAR